MLCALAFAALLVGARPGAGADLSLPFVSPYPEEPERFDREYYLDMLTLRIDRRWRSLWYGRDNAFRLQIGSLNVEQWAFVQSLKFSSAATERLRVRYRLDLVHLLDERSGRRSELEIEARLGGAWRASVLVAPAFWKREMDFGAGIQRRTAVDRYARLDLRVLDAASDFTYRYGTQIEGERRIYGAQPLELAFEMREEFGAVLRAGITASATNRWRRSVEILSDPQAGYGESGRRGKFEAWLEFDAARSWSIDVDLAAAQYRHTRSGARPASSAHNVAELLPRLWYFPRGRGGGREPAYTAGVQLRRQRWTGAGERTGDFSKNEILPVALALFPVGRAHLIEAGYLGDRYRSERTGADERTDARWENRLLFAWEVSFSSSGRLRVVETIDLDRRDHGQFWIHDHFFLSLMLGF